MKTSAKHFGLAFDP